MIATLPPADIGMPLEEVDTPALLVDLDAFERNLERMAASLAGRNLRLRPHAKSHKCPMIAHRQIGAGAVGVCCQKVGEAEAMVSGGIGNVLISNEIVGAGKINRMMSLAQQARICVCADDPFHVRAYAAAAADFQVSLDVLVEINVGAGRCGVDSAEAALTLARQICDASRLRFGGLQAYHGAAQHLRTPEERRRAIESAVGLAEKAKEMLERHNISCETVTGAGTGTYLLEADSGIYNELQAGSYIFMDVDYARNLGADGKPLEAFEHSLFVFATLISRPVKDRAVVDAGHKALPVDSGLPLVHNMPDVEYIRPSDEHGKLQLHDIARNLKIGDKLMLIPGHCDPTVNLFDWFVGIRNNRVEALWPITARGAMR